MGVNPLSLQLVLCLNKLYPLKYSNSVINVDPPYELSFTNTGAMWNYPHRIVDPSGRGIEDILERIKSLGLRVSLKDDSNVGDVIQVECWMRPAVIIFTDERSFKIFREHVLQLPLPPPALPPYTPVIIPFKPYIPDGEPTSKLEEEATLEVFLKNFPELKTKVIDASLNKNFCFEYTVAEAKDFPEIMALFLKPTETTQGRPLGEFCRKSVWNPKVIEVDWLGMIRKAESFWM